MSARILLVTEKYRPNENQRDGGARLVETIKKAFRNSLSIIQFGPQTDSSATWHFNYPFNLSNRFENRLANANFIAEHVKAVEQEFTHIIFIHISMQFGVFNLSLKEKVQIWTFPMFLTPSYLASGEIVPESYLAAERITLNHSKNILTPSHLEKRQLIEFYSIPEERIHVIPRGIDMNLLTPEIRCLKEPPKFCSVGSIKPQKNTVELIHFFAKIRVKFPKATLKIIGPVQNSQYYIKVQKVIQSLDLEKAIELTGYIPPDKLSLILKDSHLHLSVSAWETFGRSIFETLASGLPNIAKKTGNAAAEFLKNLPYARFIDTPDEALEAVEEILLNLSKLSSMALEVGRLYNDEMLSQLLVAKIYNKDSIGISDFDGTLFHKSDPEKTQRCIKEFQKFSIRVICSARSIPNLLDILKIYNLEVDWIVGCSGAVVTNGHGKLLWHVPLNLKEVIRLETLVSEAKRIEFEGEVVQVNFPINLLPDTFGLRIEVYQNNAFITHWEASKFHAIHRLLHHIRWRGQVQVFGDGPYDIELLNYFDGVLITSSPCNNHQRKEIGNV